MVAIVRFVDVWAYRLQLQNLCSPYFDQSVNRPLYLSGIISKQDIRTLQATENFVWFANAEYYPFSHAVSKSR